MSGAYYVAADTQVYRLPSSEAVARLVASHGLQAATERWHYVGKRTLSGMATSWRASQGQAAAASRTRSYTDMDAAVCIEASHALGSMTRGERAAGLLPKSVGHGIFESRGLKSVATPPVERGRLSRLGQAANRRDAAAIAERTTRLAHELAVGRVLRAALAIVPEQPRTGRYVLPPLDDELRQALAGEPAEAVAAVFPLSPRRD